LTWRAPAVTAGSVRRRPRLGERAVGVVYVCVSAVAFGGLPIFGRLAYDAGTDIVAVLFLRFLLASACMLALMRARGRRLPRGRLLGALAAMGAVGYVGQSATYFIALTMVSASLVALLLYLYPAIVTVTAAVVLRQRPRPVTVGALGLALVGCAFTVTSGGSGLGGGRPLGVAFGFASALIYSVYILVGSRVTPRAGAMASSTVIMLAAATVYGVAALVVRPAFPDSLGAWVAIGGLVVVSTVIAIVTFFEGVQRLGPADAATLSTLEPVVTILLAAAVLAERLAPLQLAGGVLILAAVIVLARAPSRPPASA